MQPKSKKAVSWVDHVDALQPSAEKESAPVSQGVLKDTSEGAQQDLTDMEWMRQRMKEGVVDADSPEKIFEQSDSEEESQGVSEERDPTEETILLTARLFVRNLTFTCTEEELRPLFQPFGVVSQVREISVQRWFKSSGWWREV